LQCVAVCCSVVQRVAVCCRALQCVAVCCSLLQCVTVCCSVLQCVAVSSVYIGLHVFTNMNSSHSSLLWLGRVTGFYILKKKESYTHTRTLYFLLILWTHALKRFHLKYTLLFCVYRPLIHETHRITPYFALKCIRVFSWLRSRELDMS